MEWDLPSKALLVWELGGGHFSPMGGWYFGLSWAEVVMEAELEGLFI